MWLWHNFLYTMEEAVLREDSKLGVAQSFRRFSQFTALASIAIAATVLVGWISGLQILETFIPHSPSMKPNAAIAFICLGVALLLLQEPKQSATRNRTLANCLAAIAAFFGGITLAEYMFHWNSRIDELLFRESSANASPPGRMSPHAAFMFLLMACSILLLEKETRRGRRFSQILAFVSALLSWVALIGYAYGERAFYAISSYAAFTAHGAFAALFLSLGIIAARPTKGIMRIVISEQEGGTALRRLLPFFVFLVPLLGWIRLTGERAGLFDTDMGAAILVTCNVILLAWLIYSNAKSLDQSAYLRDHAEQRLMESDERFRATFAQADVGIAHVAPDGRWLMVNQHLCDIVGYTQAELRDRTFQDITHPDDLEKDLDYVRKMLDGSINAYSMEKRYIRKDGSLTWINLMVSLIRDLSGGPKYFISVVEEINDRKQAEQEILKLNAELELRVAERTRELEQRNKELRQSEEKYRTIFEESKDAIFIVSLGKFLDINPAGLDLLGYFSKKEFLEIEMQELYVDPDQQQELRAILNEKGYVKDFELQLRKKNGEILTVLETCVRTRDTKQENEIYHGMLRDITQLKQLQEHLLHTHKLETIGRLAGGVAHDFNNILMAISGYCELLSLKAGSSGTIPEYIQQIEKALERATSLTKQLLAFGRKQMLAPKVLNLNLVIGNIRPMIERLMGDHVQTTFRFSPELGRVLADPGQIEQVIVNLTVNGRDAMPKGGALLIETANVELDEEYRKIHSYVIPGQYVMLSVADAGEGMDEQTKSHIFEPFFTTKELGKGTGLGLSTVYGIVKQSGGYIEVESEVNKGSRFQVFLPRTYQAEISERPVEVKPRPNVTSRTVLLVDDNDQVRSAISAFLKDSGYSVLAAAGGLEALKLAEKHSSSIDLLITDVVMPHLDGRDLARMMSVTSPRTKILFMSGYVGEESVERSSDSDFLQKPASMALLLEKVRTLLN